MILNINRLLCLRRELRQLLPNLTVLSCFAGIGGTELAAQAVGGFEVTDAIEINPFRQKVLRKNFPKLNIHSDIREFKGTSYYDVVTTTFPCKGMSTAGKGEGFGNKHSALWWESLRVIQECNPRFVIIENVRGFLKRGARDCIDGLRMAGYIVENPEIISAKECGAPHQRERVFVVAYRLADTDGFEWRGKIPPSWSRQAGSQIEAVKGSELANASGFGYTAESQSSSVLGKDCVAKKESGQSQPAGTQPRPGGLSLLCREVNSRRPQFPPFAEGMDDGVPSELDAYSRSGWWLDNPFCGQVSAPRRSVSDRQARISALGDSVTPQQMAAPLMRVKYLQQFFAQAIAN